MMITTNNLRKVYKIPVKKKKLSFVEKFKRLFHVESVEKVAVDKVSFNIKQGEIVGYIGPNGAGKSTTIKILTGIITPSSGECRVLGFEPHKERHEYTKNIGVVFGQRRLLQYDVAVIESFKLYKAIYEMSDKEFNSRLDFFNKILGLDRYLHIPVRKLSLGERMRCEIAASLLHKPKVVFLDEPTIGLDATAKEEIREFLKKINKEDKTTIILTTHDMDDIEELCKRVIIIDEGTLIYDGELKKIKQKFIVNKTVEIDYTHIKSKTDLDKLLKNKNIEILNNYKRHLKLKVNISGLSIPKIVKELFVLLEIEDLSVHEPKLEQVIKEIYTKGI